ncbi:plasmid recombination protein [Clostridium sp. CX1]|uniref:MobV family relaxase n=1 Tax=Clostridium sp. CX1 TaxID=2978346 RepID=UPI0021C1E841|nr:MobV family relaxase [Clostridium sp. CX1]MCT8975474.1 plasmid recombination protein [Clostridium sp. CX1]
MIKFDFLEDDVKLLDKKPEQLKQKDITAAHVRGNKHYCIFRVGARYHNLAGVETFEKHMERKEEVLNADPKRAKFNKIIKGSSNITKDLQEYLKNVKVRKNSVLATSMLLTASHEYFEKMPAGEKERWINKNVQWLNRTFGEDRILYISSHEDERTLHLNILFCPRVYDEKHKCYKLANKRFFGNKQRMSALQDSYGSSMKDLGLIRGIKGSKATHVKISQYYTLMNKKIDTKDIKSVCAKALNNDLIEKKVIELQKTLHFYKDIMEVSDRKDKEALKDNRVLYKQIKELQSQREVLRETIKAMSKLYKVPESSINQILNYAKNQVSGNDKGPEKEIKK